MKSFFSTRRSTVETTTRSSNQFHLKEIISLLEEKTESFASCRSRLSLTPKEIQEICSSLYSSSFHSNDESSSSLLTLLSSVRALRILPECPSSMSFQSDPINLSPFHCLSHLELRNVPITQVIHLSQLRSQLVHLALFASADSLDEVLKECGGDRCTDSFLWSELHSLHVSNCHSIDLGSAGLQLAPWLKTLELSYNGLTDSVMQSISTLLTLQSLNLNFNSLQRIPILAPSTRSSLRILHLRQNQLDSLNGVEQLHSLEELDVAYNCISNGEALSSLSFLSHLVKLNLECNPLCYIKDYRLVVLRRISSSVNRKKFLLDSKSLSREDKDNVGMMAGLHFGGHPELSDSWNSSRLHTQPAVVVSVADEFPNESASVAYTPESSTSEFQHSSSNLSTTKLGQSSLFARKLSSESCNLAPGMTPSSFSATKRRKGNRMREVEISEYAEPVTTTESPNPSLKAEMVKSASPDLTKPVVDPEHLTTKQRVEELRRTFGQENWLTSQAGNEVRLLLGWQEALVDHTTDPINTNFIAGVGELESETSEATNSVKDGSIIILGDSNEETSSVHHLHLNQRALAIDDEVETDDLCVFVVQRQLDSESQEERLLTVSEVYLYEKDALSGQTLFSWKRSSLQTVTVLDPPECSSRSVVRVKFSFLHAFCRNSGSDEITYVMEQDDFSELQKMIPAGVSGCEPKSNHHESDDRRMINDMCCMKCDGKFPALRAAVRLRTVITSPLLKGQLEEYLVCPYCASDIVFTVEHQNTFGSSQGKLTGNEELSSESSSSNQSGSDVIVASNDHYSPAEGGGDVSDTSEGGSVEVMTMHLADSVEYSTPSKDKGFSFNTEFKFGPKSLSSRSRSSKSSSQTSHGNNTAVPLPSVRPSCIAPPFNFSYADFSQVDHRLRLYCEMFILSHPTEEFHGLVKVDLVTVNAIPVDKELIPAPSLLIVTSHKLYFIAIAAMSSCEPPEKWLSLVSSYPLHKLENISTVIGNQGVVLKFTSSLSPHLVLLRDQRRTKNLTHFLADSFEKSGLSLPVLRGDLMEDQWSAIECLVAGDQDTNSTSSLDGEACAARRIISDNSSRVFLLCVTCQVEWGTNHQLQKKSHDNTALMIASDRMALVRGDPRWMTSHEVQFRTWGVSLLSLQQLVNLVSLESFVSKPEQIRCYFLDEASGMEEKWTVSLATREAVDQLIEAVRYPWEAVFSVELEINELDE